MMSRKHSFCLGLSLAALFAMVVAPTLFAGAGTPVSVEPKNSWRGIVPLRSSGADIARVLGVETDAAGGQSGPHRVDGGEVTFYYLTSSLAQIYRAPKAVVGKVFTIYFKPSEETPRDSLKLTTGFKRCVERMAAGHYYMVSEAGVAYQFQSRSDLLETVIYQPSRAQVRSLAVNTECVF